MGVKLTDLASFAGRMGVKTSPYKITLTQAECDWIVWQIDEELGRNKSVLKRKCSTNIKPKTREKFERQREFLNELKSKLQ